MKVIEISSITLKFVYNEYIPNINKGDLIGYKGDTYKVYEICQTDKELFIKLEMIYRGVNIFAISKENEVIKIFDYNLSCKKEI